MNEKCGNKHALGGQLCIRKPGHGGPHRSKAERGTEGTITYSEWTARDGVFESHVGYRTIYPINARKP